MQLFTLKRSIEIQKLTFIWKLLFWEKKMVEHFGLHLKGAFIVDDSCAYLVYDPSKWKSMRKQTMKEELLLTRNRKKGRTTSKLERRTKYKMKMGSARMSSGTGEMSPKEGKKARCLSEHDDAWEATKVCESVEPEVSGYDRSKINGNRPDPEWMWSNCSFVCCRNWNGAADLDAFRVRMNKSCEWNAR